MHKKINLTLKQLKSVKKKHFFMSKQAFLRIFVLLSCFCDMYCTQT